MRTGTFKLREAFLAAKVNESNRDSPLVRRVLRVAERQILHKPRVKKEG